MARKQQTMRLDFCTVMVYNIKSEKQNKENIYEDLSSGLRRQPHGSGRL